MRGSGRGFTLTELAVVLAILALLLAALLPVIGPMRRRGRLQQGTAGVAGTLNAARALSVARSRDCVVYIYAEAAPTPDEMRAFLEGETAPARTEQLPDRVDFCAPLEAPGYIRFRPDGSCATSGAAIFVRGEDGSRRKISVSPASGRVKVETVK